MSPKRGVGFFRALASALVDYVFSFRHWYRWKVRQRPHTGWPEAVAFFFFLLGVAYLLIGYM